MKKKPRRKRKKRYGRGKGLSTGVRAAALFLLILLLAGLVWCNKTEPVRQEGEVRAVWLAYVDFKSLGLYNKDEKTFRQNAEAFFQEAEKNAINTVYFHVRAFRDASYPSQHFAMSKYIWNKKENISYDPLKIMVKLAHKHNMELHAWLNPYRGYDLEQPILDPASEKSTEEILLCVDEILKNYKVDGIHFDDYFYKEDSQVPESEKKENVNKMVAAVYDKVKEYGEDLQFGISPAGNVSYCESIGADVKTWLSQEGYLDYVVPQIYWTDQHSAKWREKMFTDTLEEWISLNKQKVPLYPGLALYRTGQVSTDDPGWGKSRQNIAEQLVLLREKGCGGFALFSAKDFYRKSAGKELRNYQKEVVKK